MINRNYDNPIAVFLRQSNRKLVIEKSNPRPKIHSYVLPTELKNESRKTTHRRRSGQSRHTPKHLEFGEEMTSKKQRGNRSTEPPRNPRAVSISRTARDSVKPEISEPSIAEIQSDLAEKMKTLESEIPGLNR